MKLVLVSIVLFAAVCIASTTKLLASSSRQSNHWNAHLLKRLAKRQAYNGEYCLKNILIKTKKKLIRLIFI